MSKFVEKFVPKQYVDKFWRALLFRPSDPHNLTQTPAQFEYKTGVPEIKGYRYPSPGSQPPINLQHVDSIDQIWDTRFYSRDASNLPMQEYLVLNSNSDLRVEIKKLKLGSPGQKNPAVARYDSSGLRSAMTANWAGYEQELKKITPDHFPEPVWLSHERSATDAEGKEIKLKGWELLAAEAEEKGLPYRFGKKQFLTPNVPVEAIW